MQLLQRVEDRAKSNMSELVGHASEQKKKRTTGKKVEATFKNSAAKSKMQRKWVRKLKEFKLGRRLVVC